MPTNDIPGGKKVVYFVQPAQPAGSQRAQLSAGSAWHLARNGRGANERAGDEVRLCRDGKVALTAAFTGNSATSEQAIIYILC